MPGTRCALYGCNNTYKKRQEGNEHFRFHRFPKAKDLVSQTIRKEWIVRCRRKDTVNPDTSCICSVHFTADDYERDLRNELLGLPLRTILKKTAVPSLGLYREEPLEEAVTSSSSSRGERLATIDDSQDSNINSLERGCESATGTKRKRGTSCTCKDEIMEIQKNICLEKLEHQRRLHSTREQTARLEMEVAQMNLRTAQLQEELAKFNLDMAKRKQY